jgi:hypothetical protein
MSKNPKLKKNGGQGTAVGNALRFLVKQGKTISPKILDLAGDLTGLESLKELGDAIKGDDGIVQVDKDLLLRELQQDVIEMQEVTKRWSSDMMSDSWLSKNIRPLSLAFLTLTLFIYVILDSSLEGFKIASEWISLLGNLLMLTYGGYFGARTLEKIRKK